MLGKWDVGRPQAPQGLWAALSIHSLPPPAVDCCDCPQEGEVAGGLVVTGPPPPRKLKTLGQPLVAGWGRHKEGLCAAGWAAHRILGEAAGAGFRPVLLPAEAAGMPGALAQPGLSGPPAAPSPVFLGLEV